MNPPILHTRVAASGHDRAAALYIRYARRLTAYITARLGRDYPLAADLAEATWAQVRARPGTVPVGTGRDEFGGLAHVARQTIARHYLRTRTRREPPAGRRARTSVSERPHGTPQAISQVEYAREVAA
ncbi:hypothetical protein [Streptomyces sp. NRRL S-1868]|uniref:hypothetical protein n=1 Tax=Streptomyces sp. NRRL S-1868 TaxID=1463892 RepID=UPI0004C763CA|nr:hypothetical protein [Streptomyces sp. NRRL S-1868]